MTNKRIQEIIDGMYEDVKVSLKEIQDIQSDIIVDFLHGMKSIAKEMDDDREKDTDNADN